jgi:hypothetical protein
VVVAIALLAMLALTFARRLTTSRTPAVES